MIEVTFSSDLLSIHDVGFYSRRAVPKMIQDVARGIMDL